MQSASKKRRLRLASKKSEITSRVDHNSPDPSSVGKHQSLERCQAEERVLDEVVCIPDSDSDEQSDIPVPEKLAQLRFQIREAQLSTTTTSLPQLPPTKLLTSEIARTPPSVEMDEKKDSVLYKPLPKPCRKCHHIKYVLNEMKKTYCPTETDFALLTEASSTCMRVDEENAAYNTEDTPHSTQQTDACPICQMIFKPGEKQIDKDGHIAACLANADDTW